MDTDHDRPIFGCLLFVCAVAAILLLAACSSPAPHEVQAGTINQLLQENSRLADTAIQLAQQSNGVPGWAIVVIVALLVVLILVTVFALWQRQPAIIVTQPQQPAQPQVLAPPQWPKVLNTSWGRVAVLPEPGEKTLFYLQRIERLADMLEVPALPPASEEL